MEKTETYTHPLTLNKERVKEEGIVVLDGARGLPAADGPFISPDYVICIAHRGHMDLMYDDYPDFTEQYTVGVIFPNHSLVTVNSTDDYLATLIVADVSMMNDPMLQIINQMRYRYEPHPCVKLDKHEYTVIMDVVEIMRETVRINLPDKKVLMARQLEFFLRLLSHYRTSKLNETDTDRRISTQFRNDLAQCFRKHRDVSFYADKACLSTKYFGTVIKQETGHSAAYWIHSHVIAEAKMLLHMRHDLSIQAIADMLGFVEQNAFSRYFKRETGMSPSEYREMD